MTVACPQCASEQPEGMRFCGACGARIVTRCAVCGTPVAQADQRFCGGCGAPLPREHAVPRERRLVSILFGDLVNFTGFSESRDPEDVTDVLDHYFTAVRRIVEAYGGTIEKFIGDAVMAVWGTPVAREDDAERAVRAGLEVTAAIDELAGQLSVPALKLRVGVLTGEAAVNQTNVMQGMVVGDAVNTAARIQALAPAGQVYVDDVTRHATERSIVYEPGGTHELKGKAGPVRAWRAARVVSLRGGGGRPGAVEPALVGRDAELARLKAALHRVLDGEPGARVLTVTGEAGLGKSRLAWELHKYADGLAAPVRWLQGRALDFGEGVGLSPLAEMLRTAIGIRTADSAQAERVQLSDWLAERWPEPSPDRDRAHDAVTRLLALASGPALVEPGQLFSSWRAVLEREATRAPLVLCFEELQRAEDSLLAFIGSLLDWFEGPVLVLLLGRPDARLDPLACRGERIGLTPLEDAQIDRLVRSVVEDPPAQLLNTVRADGGGVPLFAVETLRALADAGRLEARSGRYVLRDAVGEVEVPPTLRALVASRLDRLGALERRTLAGGAVLGESFSARGAGTLAGIDSTDARTLLEGLVGKDLLRLQPRAEGAPEPGFEFLQGVVRRVLLSSLPRRERRRLHLAAIEHLTAIPATPDLAVQLGNHLLAAEAADPDAADAPDLRRRAGLSLRDAAERAVTVGSLEEAVALLDRAVALTEDESTRARLLERAGEVARQAGDGALAAERYRAAGELHAGAGRERERLVARLHELRARRYQRDPAALVAELEALDAALSDRTDAAGALAGAVLAFTLYQCDRCEEAVPIAARAAQVAEAAQARTELVMALSAQASSLGVLGRPDESLELYRRALALIRERDELRAAATSGSIAIVLGALGRFDEAIAMAAEAQQSARRASDRLTLRWARVVRARCLCSLGDWDEVELEIGAVKDDLPPFQLSMASAPLAVIALARGQVDRAAAIVAEYDRRCRADGTSLYEPDFRVLRALVLAVAEGDEARIARLIPEAEPADYAEWVGWLPATVDQLVAGAADRPLADALEALREDRRMKRVPQVQAQAERLEAHLLRRAGERTGALERFDRAAALAEPCGLRFETAVLALERAEAAGGRAATGGLAGPIATFERLRAEPWLARARAFVQTAPALAP